MASVGATPAKLNSYAAKLLPALRKVGDATGAPLSTRTKEDRIRLQKVVYLLKVSGYVPAQRFEYNLYINGPYSPDLTQVYFSVDPNEFVKGPRAPDLNPEVLRFVEEADKEGVTFLEALATVLDLFARSGGSHAGVALAWAKSIKPHISDAEWMKVRLFLSRHPEMLKRPAPLPPLRRRHYDDGGPDPFVASEG